MKNRQGSNFNRPRKHGGEKNGCSAKKKIIPLSNCRNVLLQESSHAVPLDNTAQTE